MQIINCVPNLNETAYALCKCDIDKIILKNTIDSLNGEMSLLLIFGGLLLLLLAVWGISRDGIKNGEEKGRKKTKLIGMGCMGNEEREKEEYWEGIALAVGKKYKTEKEREAFLNGMKVVITRLKSNQRAKRRAERRL